MIKVYLGAMKELHGCTQLEIDTIMSDLTLKNPAYANALKFSPYASTRIPKNLEYFYEANGILLVPRGYKIPFEYKVKEDERFEHTVDYPKFVLNLRDAQLKASEEYLRGEKDDAIIVLPTGTGKSLVGIYLAYILRQKALIIVQKDDLVSGWRNDIIKALRIRPKQIGLIKAQDFRIGEQLTITTIQTLSKLSPDKLKIVKNEFSMLLQDETHHIAARSYDILSTFPAKYRIGLTATDLRNDGLDHVMNFYFGDVVFRCTEADGIVPPEDVLIKVKEVETVYVPKTTYINRYGREVFAVENFMGRLVNIETASMDIIKDNIKRGKIREKPLEFYKVKDVVQACPKFMHSIVSDIVREAKNKKSCIVFCSEKEHCEAIAKELEKHILAKKIQLYYGDSKQTKEEMKRRAENKKDILVTIATFSIATEGTNVKAWERIFFGFSVGNEKDLVQAIGRGRRVLKGKDDLVVYDYRFPFVRGLENHGRKRDFVYRKYGFKISYINESTSIITRGWAI